MWKTAILLLLALTTGAGVTRAAALSDAQTEEARAAVQQMLEPARLGAGYASLINFAINPDIAAASYKIDDGEELALDVYKAPLRFYLGSDSLDWRPFLQLDFAFQELTDRFTLDTANSIDLSWQAYGGSLTAGGEIPLSRALKIIPALRFGIVHLENDADYKGADAEAAYAPIFSGWLFDWKTDAWLLGGSLALAYDKKLPCFDLSIKSSLAHNYLKSYRTSNEILDFSSSATTFDIRIETVHPTCLTISGIPLSVVPSFGNTTFLGNHRQELGFSHFFEAGIALEADLSKASGATSKLRVGTEVIFGKDISGGSLILSYQF